MIAWKFEMTLKTKGDAVERLADELARRMRTTKSNAVRIALEHELERTEAAASLQDRLRPLQDQIAARPAGPDADKAFFDDLSGGL